MLRSQRYAQAAYEAASKFAGGSKSGKEFRTLCMHFPSLLHTSGLIQAVTFYQSKEKEQDSMHAQYLRALGEAVFESQNLNWSLIRTASVGDYQKMTRDFMDVSIWMKRYAEALITAE